MLTSAALVLMMTGPGLALFYGGLVRRKNTLAIMMQSFAMMGWITVLWALVGYSLAFGGNGPIIGDLSHAFLRGVGTAPNADYAGTIPQLTFMVYQLMFAVITPALITGATAERMKFSGTMLFMTLWFFVVYVPLAHMVWGKGGLLNASLGGKFPCLDFAGGTVVHISSGVSALVCALYMGKRVGFPKQPMPVVGRLVWIQRRERIGGQRVGRERVCGDAFRGGRGGVWLERGGVAEKRQSQRARRDFRSGGRTGGHHSRSGFCASDAGAGDWTGGRSGVLSDGDEGEGALRV
jgi:hypothetical protein